MRRLPLYSVSVSPPSSSPNLIDCFILTGRYLFYATLLRSLFDLRFANCRLNDGCNSAISCQIIPRFVYTYVFTISSFSFPSIIPVNDLTQRHATLY